MINPKDIQENTQEVIKRLNTRGGNYTSRINKLKRLLQEKNHYQSEFENENAYNNKIEKEVRIKIFQLKKTREEMEKNTGKFKSLNASLQNYSTTNNYSKKGQKEELIRKEIKITEETISKLDKEWKFIESGIKKHLEKLKKSGSKKIFDEKKNQFDKEILRIPNLPSNDVPIGKDESGNIVIKKRNTSIIHNFENEKNILPHWDIADKLGWAGWELGASLSGSRFLVYSGLGAKMIRVLGDVLLNLHVKNGYTEYNIPLIVNQETMQNTGQLPKFAGDAYRTGKQYLIPTSEVPLTNFVAHLILSYKDLPLNFTAFSPCFRQEAGAAGRDNQGMIRLHQFNKVELVKIVTPDKGEKEFKNLVKEVELALNLFKLPYRIVNLCTGDLGFSSMKTYDFEVWFPSQQKYREISSCSLCGDFQARNMQARYRDESGKTQFVFTLNGSGVAIDRLLAALLENYWDGEKLILPKVLQPYFDNRKYLN